MLADAREGVCERSYRIPGGCFFVYWEGGHERFSCATARGG